MIQLDPTARTVAAALATLADLARDRDPVLSAWAAQAGRRLALGLDAAQALGLDPRALARARLSARDRHLRAAWLAVSDDPDLSARGRALLLLQAAHRFESGLWLRVRNRTEAPPGLSPIQRHLFAALRAGDGRLPRYRRVIDLCNSGLV